MCKKVILTQLHIPVPTCFGLYSKPVHL